MNKTILIVDDEEIIREALDMLLSAEYQLFFAENGVEALAKALQERRLARGRRCRRR